ncbi:MAG: DNA repair protein RadA, partial [Psychrobacter urativorans]
MAKNTSSYVCQHCGAHFGKWAGQCSDCGEWNSLVEAPNVSMPHHNKKTPKPAPRAAPRNADANSSTTGNYSGTHSAVMPLNAVSVTLDSRMSTGISEFDRVLGGGLVAGSV